MTDLLSLPGAPRRSMHLQRQTCYKIEGAVLSNWAHLQLSAEPGLIYLEASQVQVPAGPKVALNFAETQSQLGSELVCGFPGSSSGKESACNAGRLRFHHWGRSPGEGNVYPLQYSCLENSMNRGDR